jgi:hypothetical protein
MDLKKYMDKQKGVPIEASQVQVKHNKVANESNVIALKPRTRKEIDCFAIHIKRQEYCHRYKHTQSNEMNAKVNNVLIIDWYSHMQSNWMESIIKNSY